MTDYSVKTKTRADLDMDVRLCYRTQTSVEEVPV